MTAHPAAQTVTTPTESRLPRWAALVLLLFCVLGVYLRVAGVWNQPLRGDELIALKTLEAGYGEVFSTFDGKGSHPGYTLLKLLSLDLFGWSAFDYRLPSVLAGSLTLLLLYPLGRRFVGAGPAWAGTLLLAVHPMHVFYSREGRPYAVAVLLGLVLLVGLHRALLGSRRAWLGVFLCAAFLPWIHLTGVIPVGCLALAALGWSLRTRGPTRECVAVFAAAALLSVLLYLPALEGLREYYVGKISGRDRRREIELLLLLTRFGGTTAVGAALLVGGLLSALLLGRRDRLAGLLLFVAAAAPVLGLFVSSPGGMEWAYARYLLIGLPALALALGWGFFQGGRVVTRTPAVTHAAALLLVCAATAAGPLPIHRVHRPFFNSRWALMADVPDLDVPWEKSPVLYRQLGEDPSDLTIVEFPYPSDTIELYRNYELQHGHRTLIGVTEGTGMFGRPPYFTIHESELPTGDVDWVILHLDLLEELADYGRSVRMRLHAGIQPPLRLDLIRQAWGEPDFLDELVAAWRIERQDR